MVMREHRKAQQVTIGQSRCLMLRSSNFSVNEHGIRLIKSLLWLHTENVREISVKGDKSPCLPMPLPFRQRNNMAYGRWKGKATLMVAQCSTVCGSGTSGPCAVSNEYREVLVSEGVCVLGQPCAKGKMT